MEAFSMIIGVIVMIFRMILFPFLIPLKLVTMYIGEEDMLDAY